MVRSKPNNKGLKRNVLALTAAVALLGAGAGLRGHDLADGAQLSAGQQYNAGERFTQSVTEKTGGSVTFNVARSASTGTWQEQIEVLQIGTNDIFIQSVGTLDRYAPAVDRGLSLSDS